MKQDRNKIFGGILFFQTHKQYKNKEITSLLLAGCIIDLFFLLLQNAGSRLFQFFFFFKVHKQHYLKVMN